MLCSCTHGSDRHYLDYAGPGVSGGVLSYCLVEGCPCKKFSQVDMVVTPVQLIPGQTFPNRTFTGTSKVQGRESNV